MKMPALILAVLLGSVAMASAEAPTINHARLPMSFELNEGQAGPNIRALSRGNGYGVLLTDQEFALVLERGQEQRHAVLRFRLSGGRAPASISGVERLPGTVSYFTGRDSAQWRTGIATYDRIRYDGVYPGIDMVFYGNQRALEYDFIVAAGADPDMIHLDVSGAKHLRLDASGSLVVETESGNVVQPKPTIYQTIDGERTLVDGRFLVSGNRISFEVGAYDRDHELVIDPTLEFLTYFGGTGTDQIKSIAVTSPSGLTFFGGLTTSAVLPGAGNPPGGGATDGFVSAINQTGTTVLLTMFLGGSGTDMVNGIALASGVVPAFLAVTGITDSADFPSLNAAQPSNGGSFDAFVTRFNIALPGGIPTATMSFSTYLGHLNVDQATGIAVSNVATGSAIFVTGSTLSANFPTLGAFQAAKGAGSDAFLTKYNANGTVAFSTFIGWGFNEQGTGVAVYNQASPLLAIPYISANLGLPSGKSIALAISMAADGLTLRYGKGFGAATATTVATGIAVDNFGSAYLTGGTDDPALPMVAAVQPTYGGNQDAYVVKLDNVGTTVFSTYYGGVGYERAFGVAVDTFSGGNNNIIIGGLTTNGFPATAVQTTYGGGAADGFVVLFAGGVAYTVGYATYLGGTGTDVVYTVSVGSGHNARVAGITNSPGISTAGVAQPAISAGYDGFVTLIDTTP